MVSSVFNEMIFTFGDVHCDPHPANMLLRKAPQGGGMQLVLLDHGLYRCSFDTVPQHFLFLSIAEITNI